MNEQKQEIIQKLKDANNILVTVSSNPSVDQLSAAIGLTILLNRLKKHATAVFSGAVPNAIAFLKPEETIETNTDSLRDFIIALDKSKADKLRYKVEENIVKIFITPYKTSITQNDLDFSQGDFNVDVVLTLGVHEQQELDQAITAHGRILHDATVIGVNIHPGGELGVINWVQPDASSLSELAVELVDGLAKDQMDAQIATALLTGIVAETDRFSNEKTSPLTMSLSAELMAAGANQQLVANELEGSRPSAAPAAVAAVAAPSSDDGTLEISHQPTAAAAESPTEPVEPEALVSTVDETDSQSGVPLLPPTEPQVERHLLTSNDTNNPLTANSVAEDLGEAGGLPSHEPELPLLTRNEPASTDMPDPIHDKTRAATVMPPSDPPLPSELPQMDLPSPIIEPTVPLASPIQTPPLPPMDNFLSLTSEPPVTPMAAPLPPLPSLSTPAPDPIPTPPLAQVPLPPRTGDTLADIEQAVNSPHTQPDSTPGASVDAARDAVLDAINSVPPTQESLPPKADVGASGYLDVHNLPDDPAAAPNNQPLSTLPVSQPLPYVPEPTPGNTPADTPLTMPLPPSPAMSFPSDPLTPITPPVSLPDSSLNNGMPPPPPVPPPMTDLPPFVNPSK